MTCIEKLKADNPGLDDSAISEILEYECPHDYGYVKKNPRCGKKDYSCKDDCWMREIDISNKKTVLTDVASVIEDEGFSHVINTPVIKDSGDRTEFASGAVRDMHEGKGRMDLLPWAAIMEVSKHCENGAKKYGEHNVDKGIPTSSLCDSGARHLAKYLDGWDDEPHLIAAAWNLLWAIQMKIKHKDLDDTPWNKSTIENNPED